MDETAEELKPCQIAAIRHVFECSRHAKPKVATDANDNSKFDIFYEAEYSRIADLIQGELPIDVHFHPDRIAKNGRAVIDGMLATMRYENQYVSGISNGLLDTSAGSYRRRWESRLSGRAYDDQNDALRPKYGAVNLFDCQDGACARFGSCYLRLKPHVHRRCTLSYGDSHLEPENTGTPDSLDLILSALHADYSGDGEIDRKGTSLRSLSSRLVKPHVCEHESRLCRNLDDIIEVQVHGDLVINRDVEFISADSSLKGTEAGRKIDQLAANARIRVTWRPALRLTIRTVPSDFRGENVLGFMAYCWQDGYVDACRLGDVANAVTSDPDGWSEFGRQRDVLQLIKQTWHCIAAYGVPVNPEK